MERIASGFALAEAPVVAPDGGLWFADAVAGGVYRWSPVSSPSTSTVASTPVPVAKV